jgi:hypoxanthine phosphoribosyltransferase
VKHQPEVMLSEAAIAERIDSLAAEIVAGLPTEARESELIIVGLLKGAVIFQADLGRALWRHGLRLSFDYLWLSSYGAATESSGTVNMLADMHQDPSGRHVLLIDDIIDTGRTMLFAREHLLARGPASLTTILFLDKPARRVVEVPVDHVGFEIPDRFVIGYGTDYAEGYREVPYIGVLDGE